MFCLGLVTCPGQFWRLRGAVTAIGFAFSQDCCLLPLPLRQYNQAGLPPLLTQLKSNFVRRFPVIFDDKPDRAANIRATCELNITQKFLMLSVRARQKLNFTYAFCLLHTRSCTATTGPTLPERTSRCRNRVAGRLRPCNVRDGRVGRSRPSTRAPSSRILHRTTTNKGARPTIGPSDRRLE